MTEREYRYWLCRIPKIGREKQDSLFQVFGSAEELAHAKEKDLLRYNEICQEEVMAYEEQNLERKGKKMLTDSEIELILREQAFLSKALEDLTRLEEDGIHFVSCEDGDYPDKLHTLTDKPLWLFVKGNFPDESLPSVAIVGARRCSSYGKESADYLAHQLVMRQVNVISGMALGVDEYAHKGAIDGIKKLRSEIYPANTQMSADNTEHQAGSFAVLGSGVDVCYPAKNANLYHDMINGCGGIISEYLPGDAPLSWHFPYRNRIISGLADRIVVVEARSKSGSLITADAALEQNKDVWAIPGRLTDPLSEGCNQLIAQGAGIIADIDRFIEELYGASATGEGRKSVIPLSEMEEKVLGALQARETHIETLALKLKMDFAMLAPILYHLKAEKLVSEPVRNYYKKISR